jgi:L-ascorbate metabolism protein UlaG (beta-lactamase superfamily)
MQIQLIRNATLRLTYNGQVILIDPYFAPKHTLSSYADKSMNPLVDLPMVPANILDGVQAIIVSHLHTDHFDSVAKELLPKNLPLFCQPGNDDVIRERGFQDVRVIEDQVSWNGIAITRTDGRHGDLETVPLMGTVSGFVFESEDEPTLYWTGDTIWYDVIERVIETKHPDVIVTHSCGATWKGSAPIVMDAEQTAAVCRTAPNSNIVAMHMDSLDHATVSRVDLRQYADAQGISPQQLLIPADGDIIDFQAVDD